MSSGADWIFGVNVLSLSSSHDSSCCPEVLRRIGTSRRSPPLFQSPRCSYASRLGRQQRQQCSSNLPAAHWLCILCHGAIGRRATDCCASGDTSQPSARFQRHRAAGNDTGRLKREYTRKRKNDGGLWRMYKRFTPIQVRLLLAGTSQRRAPSFTHYFFWRLTLNVSAHAELMVPSTG